MCQCPLGLISHFYQFRLAIARNGNWIGVNALSGLYLISTLTARLPETGHLIWCQCPLGLIHHFYGFERHNETKMISVSMPSRAYTSFLRLMTFEITDFVTELCQCPLGLIHHFYVPLQKPRFYAVSRACFCRYLSEYSDNSRFSCMLTFWTYLMRCTYPWHWIKYSTNYNRCHPIFSLSW